MNVNTILPFILLVLGIFLISRVRSTLAGYVMFQPPTSLVWIFERIARGMQLAMITLLVVGMAFTEWQMPKDRRPFFEIAKREDVPYFIILTERPPTAISPDDPYWLQREKREAMLKWEARSRSR